MLFQIFRSKEAFFFFLLSLPVILLALTVHEAAHGYVAYKQGDPTPKALGRLTLNPIKHFDLIGFLAMALCGFGWAKPVPINPRYFRDPRRGTALTALAGPTSNLLLSYLGFVLMTVVFGICCRLSPLPEMWLWGGNGFDAIFYTCMTTTSLGLKLPGLLGLFCYLFAYYNLAFCLFNLIPIPPFDGSRVLGLILPAKYYFKIMRYERTILLVVLLLLATGLVSVPLGFGIEQIMRFFRFTLSWLPFY